VVLYGEEGHGINSQYVCLGVLSPARGAEHCSYTGVLNK
jgi:hypothetical protein